MGAGHSKGRAPDRPSSLASQLLRGIGVGRGGSRRRGFFRSKLACDEGRPFKKDGAQCTAFAGKPALPEELDPIGSLQELELSGSPPISTYLTADRLNLAADDFVVFVQRLVNVSTGDLQYLTVL